MNSMYVADRQNHRIQLFHPNQLSGVSIAGILQIYFDNDTTHSMNRFLFDLIVN